MRASSARAFRNHEHEIIATGAASLGRRHVRCLSWGSRCRVLASAVRPSTLASCRRLRPIACCEPSTICPPCPAADTSAPFLGRFYTRFLNRPSGAVDVIEARLREVNSPEISWLRRSSEYLGAAGVGRHAGDDGGHPARVSDGALPGGRAARLRVRLRQPVPLRTVAGVHRLAQSTGLRM